MIAAELEVACQDWLPPSWGGSGHTLADWASLDPRFRSFKRGIFLGLVGWSEPKRLTMTEAFQEVALEIGEAVEPQTLRQLAEERAGRRCRSTAKMSSAMRSLGWIFERDAMLWRPPT
jgi:hypothetical protein